MGHEDDLKTAHDSSKIYQPNSVKESQEKGMFRSKTLYGMVCENAFLLSFPSVNFS